MFARHFQEITIQHSEPLFQYLFNIVQLLRISDL